MRACAVRGEHVLPKPRPAVQWRRDARHVGEVRKGGGRLGRCPPVMQACAGMQVGGGGRAGGSHSRSAGRAAPTSRAAGMMSHFRHASTSNSSWRSRPAGMPAEGGNGGLWGERVGWDGGSEGQGTGGKRRAAGAGAPGGGGGWWCLSTRQRWAVEGWCGSGAAAGDAPAMTNGLPGPWVHTYLFASPPSQLTTPRGAPGRTHPPVRPYRPPTKPTSDACHDVGVRGIGAVGLKFERHPEAGGQQGLDVH